jgi:hypothetical protein
MAIGFKTLFDELDRKREFFDRNQQRFLELYEDQFVAVDKEGEVVLTSPNLAGMLDGLEQAGLDVVNDVDVEYVTTKWNTLIL